MNKLVETKLRKLIQKEIKSVLKENTSDIHELVDQLDDPLSKITDVFDDMQTYIHANETKYNKIAISEIKNMFNSAKQLANSWDKWKANYL